MERRIDPVITDLMSKLILESFRVKDEQLNGIAAALVRRMGSCMVPQMFRLASDSKNQSAHRVRILRALRPIITTADPAVTMDLFILAADKNAAVRQAAKELIMVLPERQVAAPATA